MNNKLWTRKKDNSYSENQTENKRMKLEETLAIQYLGGYIVSIYNVRF